MSENKTIKRYAEIDSSFSDYRRFKEPSSSRTAAKEAFIADRTYAPDFKYPSIEFLFDKLDKEDRESVNDKDHYLHIKKSRIQKAVYELDSYSDTNPEALLYSNFHQTRLLRIMLNEASYRMLFATNEDSRSIAAKEFSTIGRELYGPMDKELFLGITHNYKHKIDQFIPKTDQALSIKNSLQNVFTQCYIDGPEPEPIIDKETLLKIRATINKRYEKLFGVFPGTDDNVYYNAQQSAEILNDALATTGLSYFGWKAIVDNNIQIVSTDGEFQTISLPSNLRRNSAELVRLYIHEGEVHARRYENGKRRSVLLSRGTANYADVEEGVGLLLECALVGEIKSPALDRAEERYLLAGIATGLFGPLRDARQSHELLWRLIAVKQNHHGVIGQKEIKKAKTASVVHIENAFRGTPTTIPGIIYPKLKIYLEGLVKNCRLFQSYNGDYNDLLDKIMLGKYDHTNPTEAALVLGYFLEKQ